MDKLQPAKVQLHVGHAWMTTLNHLNIYNKHRHEGILNHSYDYENMYVTVVICLLGLRSQRVIVSRLSVFKNDHKKLTQMWQ